MGNKKTGFTLVEMLVVVVIAASVVVLSVPAFTRVQDRSRFDAAKGLLMDLGMATQSLRADWTAVNSSADTYPTSSLQVTSAAQSAGTSTSAFATDPLSSQSSANFVKILFAKDYLRPIPFDSGTSVYKGYSFYVCKVNATGGDCCDTKDTVACMYNSGAGANYKKARYLETSGIVRG